MCKTLLFSNCKVSLQMIIVIAAAAAVVVKKCETCLHAFR
jgi:hypothetical protein